MCSAHREFSSENIMFSPLCCAFPYCAGGKMLRRLLFALFLSVYQTKIVWISSFSLLPSLRWCYWVDDVIVDGEERSSQLFNCVILLSQSCDSLSSYHETQLVVGSNSWQTLWFFSEIQSHLFFTVNNFSLFVILLSFFFFLFAYTESLISLSLVWSFSYENENWVSRTHFSATNSLLTLLTLYIFHTISFMLSVRDETWKQQHGSVE